jgi:hypothetical protein
MLTAPLQSKTSQFPVKTRTTPEQCAVIPVGSVYFRQSGSDFFGSTTYGLENSLVDFDETLTTKNLSMKVDAGTASLSVDQAAWKAAFRLDTMLTLAPMIARIFRLPLTKTR